MYEYKATVRRVVDGDTLEVDIDLGFKTILQKEKVRLIGIDTPELRSSNSEERIHAQQAKNFVVKLLEGKEVILNTEKDVKGKYGRYLARVKFLYASSDGEEIYGDLSEELKQWGYEKKEKY